MSTLLLDIPTQPGEWYTVQTTEDSEARVVVVINEENRAVDDTGWVAGKGLLYNPQKITKEEAKKNVEATITKMQANKKPTKLDLTYREKIENFYKKHFEQA